MLKFIVRRILQLIPTLIGIAIISFVMIHIVPGNPVRTMLGEHYTLARAAAVSKEFGLNKPLWQQFLIWLVDLLHGNLGYSYVYNEPVVSLIFQALPHTLIIVVVSVIVAHICAVFLGSLQAYYEDTIFDKIATVINYFLYSMPSFWLGVLLVIFFAIYLGWLPSGGITNPQLSNPGFGDYVSHLILPCITLFLISIAAWARYMRSSMREALLQDYIRTARMKGAREFRVIFVHALRNSILPLITMLGMSIPALLSGALFVEEIFNYPGMGLLFWDAVTSYDYPIIMGVTIFLGVITILGNLISDILYSIIDPRIQYGVMK